jgi:hypothetical protein
MTERWAVISAHSDYIVSDLGRVRHRRVCAPILRPCRDRYGYPTVLLNRKRCKIHRLVCEAFHGSAPAGKEVGHLNGDKADNRAVNLAWITRAENVRHMREHGVLRIGRPPREAMPRGSHNRASKLTETIVADARARFAAGESGRRLAKEFGVTSANMSRAIRGESWRHVAEGDAPTPDSPV